MNLHFSFHTIITLAYTIPNIYLFVRIWHLFIDKRFKIHFTIIYLLLASIYPCSNLFYDGVSGFPDILRGVAIYLLPFYLYLFLFVLAYDIFLLFNLLFRIISFEKLRSRSFKKAALSVILLLSLAVVIGGIINFNTIRTSEYHIEIPGKSSHLKHLKIAFVADFHLQEGTNKHFVERFVKKTRDIDPDLMLFGGDIVEGDKDDGNLKYFETLFSEIKTKYGVFGVLGNHEYYAGQSKGSFFDKAGIKILCDSIVLIDNSFNLGGRYDSHSGNRKTVDDLMKSAADTLPMILLDHRPTEIEQVSKTSVDVQLSGHTHDGQLFPINLITGSVYPLSWGYRKIGNTNFFVTSGIRLWGFPVRTAGKSEIMLINITFIPEGS